MAELADNKDFTEVEITKFYHSKTALLQLRFRDDELFRQALSSLLDNLNSVEYSLKIAPEEVKKSALRCSNSRV